jgi:hypothetical protein
LLHNWQLKIKEVLKYFKELSGDRVRADFSKNLPRLSLLMTTYRMSLISARSISLDITLNQHFTVDTIIYKYCLQDLNNSKETRNKFCKLSGFYSVSPGNSLKEKLREKNTRDRPFKSV